MDFLSDTSLSANKKKVYKSPVAAFLWSIALPGFGQFYNRDYFLGLVLTIWEIVINLQANVNELILLSCRGEFKASYEIVDNNWLMFYPSVFAYSIWQAYNKARSINYGQGLEKEDEPYRPKFSLFAFGCVSGANFGVFYPFLLSPLFSAITLGLVFGYIAHKIEKYQLKKKAIEVEEEDENIYFYFYRFYLFEFES